ncbi:MAG: pitrilysin family protein [Thermodesulfovibrionia bacterium]
MTIDAGVYEDVLPNGLKVIILKDPSSTVAVFQIWYHAGSVNESIGKTGLSHLLEHMMFKGTHKYGPKAFSRIISKVGGIDNAGTSKDYAFYFQKLPPDKIYLSIELEADRMRNLIMDAKEVEAEKRVVMEERRLRYEDDPQSVVYEEVMATAFKNHPYRWPVIGWMSDIEGISRDDLWDYYRRHYNPNNAFIVVAGNVDVDKVMERIRKEFGSIPRGDDIKGLVINEPIQRGEKRVYIKKEAELPYVLIAYKATNIFDDDSYALDVLAYILSDGRTSRLYKGLVDERQLAISVGADYDSLQRYPSLFYLYGTPMPGKDINDLEKALYEEIERLKKEPPTEREVQKVKNRIEAEFIMSQDSIFYQARLIGIFEMLGDWRLKDKYLDGIRRVRPEDVQRVAKKYLTEDNRTVGVLIPLKVRSEK